MRLSSLIIVLLSATVALAAAERQEAEALKQKVNAIARHGESARPFKTTILEREANAYLEHEVTDDLPNGVVAPAVSLLGAGRVTGRAVVDLDRVRKGMKPTSVFNPLSYLSGRLPVVATGAVHAQNGVGRFQLESASVAGVPVPKFVLQQIVAYYSRSERYPSGVSLDDQFALPAGIREIRIERGQAVVIQ